MARRTDNREAICYTRCMTAKALEEVLRRAERWPEEDQEALAEYARDIEARRTGVYHATPEELAAIDEGLAQAERGEFATPEEVEAAVRSFRGYEKAL